MQLPVCGSGGCNVIAWRLHNAGEPCSPLPAAPGLTSKGTENKQDLVFSKVRVRFTPLGNASWQKAKSPTLPNCTSQSFWGQKDITTVQQAIFTTLFSSLSLKRPQNRFFLRFKEVYTNRTWWHIFLIPGLLEAEAGRNV